MEREAAGRLCATYMKKKYADFARLGALGSLGRCVLFVQETVVYLC